MEDYSIIPFICVALMFKDRPVEETVHLYTTFEVLWTFLWTYVHLAVYVSIGVFAWFNAMEDTLTIAKTMSFILGAQLYFAGQTFANRLPLQIEYPR